MFILYAVGGKEITVGQSNFPDNTLSIKLPDEDIHTILWKYENDAELFTLICIRGHYSSCDIRLLLPYIPHARMDRVKNPEDVFTLKYFCQTINSMNFNEVVVLDAHSNVALALLDRVFQEPVDLPLIEVFNDLDCNNLLLFYPDEGAMKRYSGCFNKPYAFGMKKRNWETGQIEGLDLINGDLVKNRDVLIIDDICSRGGTFLHSAHALKAAGAKNVYLYVTHAENTMVYGEMYNDPNLVTHIYTTNSLFNKKNDVLNKVTIIENW